MKLLNIKNSIELKRLDILRLRKYTKKAINFKVFNKKIFKKFKINWRSKILKLVLLSYLKKQLDIKYKKKLDDPTLRVQEKYKKFSRYIYKFSKLYILSYYKVHRKSWLLINKYKNYKAHGLLKPYKNYKAHGLLSKRLTMPWLITLCSLLVLNKFKNLPLLKASKKNRQIYAHALLKRILKSTAVTAEDRLLKWLFLWRTRKIFKFTFFSSSYLYFFRLLMFGMNKQKPMYFKNFLCEIMKISPIKYWQLNYSFLNKNNLLLNKSKVITEPTVFCFPKIIKFLSEFKKIFSFFHLLHNKKTKNIIKRFKTFYNTKNLNAINFFKKNALTNRFKYSLLIYLLPFWCTYYYNKYFISGLRFVQDYWTAQFYNHSNIFFKNSFFFSGSIINYAKSFLSFFSKKHVNLKLKPFTTWLNNVWFLKKYEMLKKLWKPYKKVEWLSIKGEWKRRKKLFTSLLLKKYFTMSVFNIIFEKRKIVRFSNYNEYRRIFTFPSDYERSYKNWPLKKYKSLRNPALYSAWD